ncbi:putative GDH/6PGL endoplasmic bifunctional protein [Hypsibius exemplaris]|uniref:Glucose-6-phosphate 1-dehydrogenase n=1 Tax=Hypsibius exemplaris TaxID=2072580 RepID=A0A1W0WMF9_HYPEX|nr:putative GDH/6PGL endoplasmic bifunctional protein [Hypsibius exemplaris]
MMSPQKNLQLAVVITLGVVVIAIVFGIYNTSSSQIQPAEDQRKPVHFVLLGATGDLAVRYLFPALASLAKDDYPVKVYASSRQEPDHTSFYLEELVEKVFWKLLTFVRLKSQNDFEVFCRTIPEDVKTVFYLAIPPSGYLSAVNDIATACSSGHRNLQVVLEKPFGVNESTAADLFYSISSVLPEERIYLVDHYKAKESVRAINDFFKRNPVLTDLLTSGGVQQIEVTINETNGVENRINFFEETGIIRDVVQNHLLEVVMNILSSCRDIHPSAKPDLISNLAVRHFLADQYATYTAEVLNWTKNSTHTSTTPTFAKAVLVASIAPCWHHDLLIVLTAGKRLQQKISVAKLAFIGEAGTPREVLFHIGGGSLSYPAVLFRGFPPGDVECPHEIDAERVAYQLTVDGAAEQFSVCRLGDTFENAYEVVIRDICDWEKKFSATFRFVLNSWKLWDPWVNN